MPLSPGPSVPMGGLPSDLAGAAGQADDLTGSAVADLIPRPQRPYSPKVMTSLAKAIAAVMDKMGVEMTPQPYSGPVSEFNPDEARFLAMIEAAAADYGAPLPVALSDIKGDSELTVISAALMELAKDPEFVAFLDVEPEGAEAPEAEMEMEKDSGAPAPKDLDALFASRLRK